MEWFQVHYRVGEQWMTLLQEGLDTPKKHLYEAFARAEANSLVSSGKAIEAMVVRVESAPFCDVATGQAFENKMMSVILPIIM